MTQTFELHLIGLILKLSVNSLHLRSWAQNTACKSTFFRKLDSETGEEADQQKTPAGTLKLLYFERPTKPTN